ncbi:MAG: hypothetical protein ACFFCW_26585 [Candidatus Hodarchaeota archaeon]
MAERQGMVLLKAIQGIMILEEFTTTQLVQFTNEKKQSILTNLYRLQKRGILEECGSLRQVGPGRSRKIFRLTSEGRVNLTKELDRLRIDLPEQKTMASKSSLSLTRQSFLASIVKSPSFFSRYMGNIPTEPEIALDVPPNIEALRKHRDLVENEFPEAETLGELRALRMEAEDCLVKAGIKLGLNASLGPTTPEEELIYGYLLGKFGIMVLAEGTIILQLLLGSEAPNKVELKIEQWQKGYQAIEDSAELLRQRGLKLDREELAIYHTNFERAIQQFEARGKKFSQPPLRKAFDHHWEFLERLTQGVSADERQPRFGVEIHEYQEEVEIAVYGPQCIHA